MERLLTEVREPLFHHVMGIVREQATAEDVLQDSLYSICRKLPSLRDPRWFRAWCYRIATRNAVRRSKADRAWVAAGEESLAGLSAAEPDDTLDRDLMQTMLDAIDELPPASRLVVRMHYLDELSYSEIAEALEISAGTAKSRVAYGLSRLRLAASTR
jgi:RNA polymerase sigma-70 factor (ECF subfamily)